MTGKRRAHDPEGECRAGTFTKPHVELQNRALVDRGQKLAVARFGRGVADKAMIQQPLVCGIEHGGRSGADEPVEDHRDAFCPRRQNRAADRCLFATAEGREHAPGIDMLEGSNIRTQGKDPHMLFTIKQVASVSHQLGRRAFCEAYGVSGWDSTLEHYKRFGDWLMVHGIDFMDQHLAFSTVRGARKRDHPQSFTDVSAWWPYYKIHGDHLGRVSFLLTRGESFRAPAVPQAAAA